MMRRDSECSAVQKRQKVEHTENKDIVESDWQCRRRYARESAYTHQFIDERVMYTRFEMTDECAAIILSWDTL